MYIVFVKLVVCCTSYSVVNISVTPVKTGVSEHSIDNDSRALLNNKRGNETILKVSTLNPDTFTMHQVVINL